VRDLTQATAWTPAEDAFVRHLVQEGKDSAEIAALCQADGIARTQKAIQRRRERMQWHARVAESPAVCRKFTDRLRVEGDALLFGDPHWPFHHADFMNRCVDVALGLGIDTVGIGGDITDQSVFSKWGRDKGVEWSHEKEATKQGIRALLSNFKRVVLCPGNHDVRMIRQSQGAINEDDWVDMMRDWFAGVPPQRLLITAYHAYHVVSGGRPFRVTHPKESNRVPTSVALRLNRKHRESIVSFHSHVTGIRRDESGTDYLVDCGPCCDDERMRYVQIEDNTRPKMTRCAVLLVDGAPLLLEEDTLHVYESLRRIA
jgi:hypothetical protein